MMNKKFNFAINQWMIIYQKIACYAKEVWSWKSFENVIDIVIIWFYQYFWYTLNGAPIFYTKLCSIDVKG